MTWLGQAVHLHFPCLMGLPPAASALACWKEHGVLQLKGQVQLKARETSQQEGKPWARALQAQLEGQVQLKARETSHQEGQPGAGAQREQGLFAPGS